MKVIARLREIRFGSFVCCLDCMSKSSVVGIYFLAQFRCLAVIRRILNSGDLRFTSIGKEILSLDTLLTPT